MRGASKINEIADGRSDLCEKGKVQRYGNDLLGLLGKS